MEIVGDFVASFVPGIDDFNRLDRQFVLSPRTWSKIPEYHDYGFAVFQLKAGQGGVHPMAFSFASRFNDRLFFPTMHIHDGHVHPSSRFNHELYWQPQPKRGLSKLLSDAPAIPNAIGGNQSRYHMGNYMEAERTKGLLDKNIPGYNATLSGIRENKDTFVADRA